MSECRVAYSKYPRNISVFAKILGVAITHERERIEFSGLDDATQAERLYGVSLTRSIALPLDVSDAFALVTPEDILPKVLTGYALLPAVTGTRSHVGVWGEPGAYRVVELADGTTVNEQLIDFIPAKGFSYNVWGFENQIIKRLANGGAKGEWEFLPCETGTLVRWTYTFYASRRLAVIPIGIIVSALWRGYMDVCLHNFKQQVE